MGFTLRPASTTKLLTAGTALNQLGGEYRFYTPVYRTGLITDDGTLDGELVLVASGGPNPSRRVDSTLTSETHDHS